MKIIKELLKNERFWLILTLLIGIILRFWKIDTRSYLSYDQSRDFIIIKRIIVDHKLTLVGPTVSIAPGFYLPPFYYYSLAPFLYLFKFHIVGPDIYTAMFGVASIYLFYALVRKLFGVVPALISTFSFAVNPYLVQASRHAWNPNTIIFYILLFILASYKYKFEGKRKYLLLASFSLSWAIGLHLTAVVFVPVIIYLFIIELKKNGLNKIPLLSLLSFSTVFVPLFLFDLRHNFPILKAGLFFLRGQRSESFFHVYFQRLQLLFTDLVKVPIVLLTGLFQSQNLTVRPSNITNFGEINILQNLSAFGLIKIVFSLITLLAIVFCLFNLRKTNIKVALYICLLFFLGNLIRLLFPPNYFFFYYYLSLFPVIFLLLSLAIFVLFQRKKILGEIFCSVVILLSIFSLFPKGIQAEVKSEDYFLPACEIIAKDYNPKTKIVIANNLADKTRWEHNGLEYRYFLESIYKIQLGDWETNDYINADILYFIDEGDLKDPLSFGGMEVEAFKPTKIEKTWKVETGQKIYKMTRYTTSPS